VKRLYSIVFVLFTFSAIGEDLTSPELTSFTMSTQSVDVTSSSQTVTVYIGLRDPSGVETPNISAAGTDNEGTAGFAVVTLDSGTINDGIWKAVLTIPQNALAGSWKVNIFPVSDLASNTWDFFGPGNGYDASFTVISGNNDSEPPVLQSFQLGSQSVDVSNGSATLEVTMRITDNDSGTETPNVSARSIDGQATAGFANVTLSSGDANDGVWLATLTIPQNTVLGDWEVSIFPLTDSAGNTADSFGPGDGFDASFEVISSNSDTTPPALVDFQVDQRVINVTQGAGQLIVTMHITDAESGVETPNVSAASLLNGATAGFADVLLVAGDIYDGTWQATITIPQGITGGPWRISIFPVSDLSQNTWDFFGPGEGFDETFTVIKSAVKNDLNADGKSDLLWRSYDKGWNFLWTMDGTDMSSATPINVVVSNDWDMVGQGDYDTDGKSDIFWRNNYSGQNFIYLMDGASIKNRYSLNYVTGGSWIVAGSGDFDGDGTVDVLWRNTSRGDTWFYLMGDGVIRESLPSLWVTNLDYQIAATGDIDGDGDDDVIWRNAANGINYLWIMQDGAIANRYTLNTANTNWEIAGAGDLDGDGTDDIILRNQVTGENWVYYMENGQIRQSTLINTVADTNWVIVNIGDFDGDGRDDFLWRDETTARNIIHLMDGTTIKSRGVLRNTNNTWRVTK